MQYAKELILTDITSQGIPQAMNKRIIVNNNQNHFAQNFQHWNKNIQPMEAQDIINDSQPERKSAG